MATVKDILNILNEIAAFKDAETWDNCGLQAGDETWGVKRIIIALDVTMPVMQAALQQKADLVLTHHPLLLSPENQIDFAKMPGSAIEISAKHHISIVSVHTNLDKAVGGLNDYFADKIGLTQIQPFIEADSQESDVGIGRVGKIIPAMPLGQFADTIKKILGLEYLRVTGDLEATVKSAAVCTGSGGSLLDDFFASTMDVYVTGDMKYHDARKIEERGKLLIDVGHFGSEHIAIELLFEKLKAIIEQQKMDIELSKFNREKDPFTIV